MYDTPDALRDAAWQALSRGVADRRHPGRSPTLATITPDGPAQRTVVLRGWQDGVAEIHTDSDSDKVAELRADPRAALHVWVPKQALQIRLSGTVTLIEQDADRWARVPDNARSVYGGTPAPGRPLDDPAQFTPGADIARFCAVVLTAHRADLLYLGRNGHVRARFVATQGAWHGHWVAP